MSALPRKRKMILNDYELGWLLAAVDKEIMARMEMEAPGLWLQIQANCSQVYAESEGHPLQEQAKKEFDSFHKRLHELFDLEEKEAATP